MRKILVVVGLILAFFGSFQQVMAQAGSSAVPFLLISPTSRASGMGEGGTGLADDATAIHWNPAGLAFQKGSEISITHANWLPQFNLSDLFYDYFNFKQDLPDLGGTLGVSITYLNLGDFVKTGEQDATELEHFKGFEVAATVGFAAKVTDDFSLGTNLRFINSHLSPFGAANEKGDGIGYDFSFDVAFLYKPQHLVIPFLDEDLGDAFSVGMNISNIGPKMVYVDAAQADPLPTLMRLGFSIVPMKDEYNSLTLVVDLSKLLVYREANGASHELPKSLLTSFSKNTLSRNIELIDKSVGIEYWYDKKVAIRWGYFFEDPNNGNRNFMTLGAGLRYDIYGFDFSYISSTADANSPLSDTLRFTLLMLFDGLF